MAEWRDCGTACNLAMSNSDGRKQHELASADWASAVRARRTGMSLALAAASAEREREHERPQADRANRLSSWRAEGRVQRLQARSRRRCAVVTGQGRRVAWRASWGSPCAAAPGAGLMSRRCAVPGGRLIWLQHCLGAVGVRGSCQPVAAGAERIAAAEPAYSAPGPRSNQTRSVIRRRIARLLFFARMSSAARSLKLKLSGPACAGR